MSGPADTVSDLVVDLLKSDASPDDVRWLERQCSVLRGTDCVDMRAVSDALDMPIPRAIEVMQKGTKNMSVFILAAGVFAGNHRPLVRGDGGMVMRDLLLVLVSVHIKTKCRLPVLKGVAGATVESLPGEMMASGLRGGAEWTARFVKDAKLREVMMCSFVRASQPGVVLQSDWAWRSVTAVSLIIQAAMLSLSVFVPCEAVGRIAAFTMSAPVHFPSTKLLANGAEKSVLVGIGWRPSSIFRGFEREWFELIDGGLRASAPGAALKKGGAASLENVLHTTVDKHKWEKAPEPEDVSDVSSTSGYLAARAEITRNLPSTIKTFVVNEPASFVIKHTGVDTTWEFLTMMSVLITFMVVDAVLLAPVPAMERFQQQQRRWVGAGDLHEDMCGLIKHIKKSFSRRKRSRESLTSLCLTSRFAAVLKLDIVKTLENVLAMPSRMIVDPEGYGSGFVPRGAHVLFGGPGYAVWPLEQDGAPHAATGLATCMVERRFVNIPVGHIDPCVAWQMLVRAVKHGKALSVLQPVRVSSSAVWVVVWKKREDDADNGEALIDPADPTVESSWKRGCKRELFLLEPGTDLVVEAGCAVHIIPVSDFACVVEMRV